MERISQKYRPKVFEEVIGQDLVVRTLINAIKTKRISSGYLFAGPRGTGKTTLARIFAKALNCENLLNDYEPCNQCQNCLEINQGKFLDLIEIDAATHRGIDQIREIKEAIRFAPTTGRYKVWILDEAHMLTIEASNALLKTLEEPPSHAILILATTDPRKLPETIISRCQIFEFKRLNLSQIQKRLELIAKNEEIEITPEASFSIALASEGAMRDAESITERIFSLGVKKIDEKILEKYLGWISFQKIDEFFDLFLNKKTDLALSFINKIYENGNDLDYFLVYFLNYLRNLYFLKINSNLEKIISFSLPSEQIKIFLKKRNLVSLETLKKMIELFLRAKRELKISPLPLLPIEMAIIESCHVF
ncbi:DNA polymerase III subunit gamma/tau [bacterium]|nr:DNA polymerase III subunit gamma/tau [bacterium]